jgi:hypothetical protein
MANPETALRESIGRVDAEMRALGRSASGGPLVRQVPDDLQRIVSFTHSGPLDDAVEQVAHSAGYTVYFTRPVGWEPVNVSVRVTGRTDEVLEALGRAAGDRASVYVYPQQHAVRVIHRDPPPEARRG